MNDRPKDNEIRDIVITTKALVEGLTKSLDEYREENRKVLEDMRNDITRIDKEQSKHAEKISNWTIFQTIFSTAIGAVATYLGATWKK